MTNRGLPRGLAENIARYGTKNTQLEVPVDLIKLAHHLGVSAVSEAPMVEDGRTTWSDGIPLIELRSDRSRGRKRFTLAHEIAHILIEARQTVAHRKFRFTHDDVETLCDQVAAAILMPRDWISRYANRDVFNLSLIRLVAHKSQVSHAAAAVRIAETSGRTCMLLRLQRAPKRWVVVGHAAVPLDIHGQIEVAPATSEMFDNLPMRRDSWQYLSLVTPRGTLKGRAHVDRAGDTCLALITSLKDPV